jgi:hypothetical protein
MADVVGCAEWQNCHFKAGTGERTRRAADCAVPPRDRHHIAVTAIRQGRLQLGDRRKLLDHMVTGSLDGAYELASRMLLASCRRVMEKSDLHERVPSTK